MSIQCAIRIYMPIRIYSMDHAFLKYLYAVIFYRAGRPTHNKYTPCPPPLQTLTSGSFAAD